MNLWKIAWRSIEQRALASWLTALSMALGIALVVTVLVVYGVVDRSFKKNAEGYQLIVGAKGDPQQLVLNTVFHLSRPIENLPYSFYKEFTQGEFADDVVKVVPVCLGDNYEGYRVVGTVPEMFESRIAGQIVPESYGGQEHYRFAQGRNFKHERFFEAVIGSQVSRSTGLAVGEQFQPTHGVSDDGQGHKHDAFTVVGVLAPTGTPNDRALFVNMEGFYLLRGHAKQPPAGSSRQPGAAGGHPEDEAHDDHDHEGEHDHDAPAHDDEDPIPSPAEHASPDAHEDEHDEHDEHGHEEHGHEEHGHEEHGHEEHGQEEHGQEEHEHEEHQQSGHASGGGHDADGHDHGGDAHDHSHEHLEPLPENQREVTAILVRTQQNDILAAMNLPTRINEGPVAQAVLPTRVIYELFNTFVGPFQKLLLGLAALVVLVAGIGIMVSIYNSMSDRRREIAVMRSLGARRSTVLTVVLLESILLSLGGGLAGCLLGHGLIGLLSPALVARTGVWIGFFQFNWYELVLIPVLVVLASLVGFLPAMSAYRTDVAKALSASP